MSIRAIFERPGGWGNSPWRHRPALLALVPLAVLLLAVIVREPWYSNFDVDTLTHFEQARSVADHGSVGFFNGPVDAYPELRTRWFIAAHGRAWGIVPAGLSYLLAPAVVLGGFHGGIRAIWLLFALGAAMVYALTFRLTHRPWVAVAAAWSLVLGTSLSFWASMIAPFVPAAGLGITAVYLSSRAFDTHTPRRQAVLAAGAGGLSSAALSCHLLWTFPWAGIGLVLATATGTIAERFRRAMAYGLASTPALALMAWVNHQRFGTYNPVSYGPCDQYSCHPTTNTQTAGAFLDTIKPALPYVVLAAVIFWLARRSTRAVGIAAFLIAAAALIPDTATRTQTALLLRTAWGYVIDLGDLSMGFSQATVGPGVYLHGWCVLSLLQCVPILAVGALAGSTVPRLPPAQRSTLWLLAAVVVGVLVGGTLRANTGGAYIWGYPFLNIRYVTPLLPAAAVLTAVSLAELPWRAWHAVIAVAVCVSGALWLFHQPEGEVSLVHREVLHWLPLGLATACFACTAAWARAEDRGPGAHIAAVVAAVTLGWGGAVTLGRDVRCLQTYRAAQDARTEELARCVPEHRFALLGGYAMDEALALHDRRDIEIINVGMGPSDGHGAREILEAMPQGNRPAYLIEDEPGHPWVFHWPGYTFVPIPGCARVQRIVRAATAPSESLP